MEVTNESKQRWQAYFEKHITQQSLNNEYFTDFDQVLAEFDDVIEKAMFFSIDSEFTGMYTDKTSPYESPSELYKKITAATDEYIIVQLGITAFQQSECLWIELN